MLFVSHHLAGKGEGALNHLRWSITISGWSDYSGADSVKLSPGCRHWKWSWITEQPAVGHGDKSFVKDTIRHVYVFVSCASEPRFTHASKNNRPHINDTSLAEIGTGGSGKQPRFRELTGCGYFPIFQIRPLKLLTNSDLDPCLSNGLHIQAARIKPDLDTLPVGK